MKLIVLTLLSAAVLLNEYESKCVIGTFEVPGVSDSCFYESTEAKTMQLAREQCTRWKGRLYEPSSQQELEKVTAVLRNMDPSGKSAGFWLGYTLMRQTVLTAKFKLQDPYYGSIETYLPIPEMKWNYKNTGSCVVGDKKNNNGTWAESCDGTREYLCQMDFNTYQ
ncbi:uncharacterized protein LOC142350642 [Convolutriloba macropyga]|uniref:uncharacterized protein LOC142350642 n=1 Tax=Convolutriloba macropyga TaxID=536237 RepID=UPI003F51CDB9